MAIGRGGAAVVEADGTTAYVIGGFAAAARGRTIYVAGGRTHGGPLPPYDIAILNTFEAYDARKDQWESLRPMPTARAGLGLAAVGEKIYAIGGRTGGEL